MLVQCPACKTLVELSPFTVGDGKLSFTCSACKVGQTVLAEGTTTAVVAKSSVAPAPHGPGSGGEAPLWAGWDTLARDWDNAKAHETFVALCLELNALAFAGNRYREHADLHPTDAMANKGRDRVMMQAVAVASAARPSAMEKGTLPVRAALTALLLLGCTGMVVYAIKTFVAIVTAEPSNPLE